MTRGNSDLPHHRTNLEPVRPAQKTGEISFVFLLGILFHVHSQHPLSPDKGHKWDQHQSTGLSLDCGCPTLFCSTFQ